MRPKPERAGPACLQSKLYSQNEDKDIVWHSGVCLVIVAAKYDTFRDADPEVKKVREQSSEHPANQLITPGC